jgi:hypothetical protein
MDDKKTYIKYADLIVTSIMTATILFTSVMWYDVIEVGIDQYAPSLKGTTLKGKLIFAIIVTFIVVLMHIYLFPAIQKYFGESDKLIESEDTHLPLNRLHK